MKFDKKTKILIKMVNHLRSKIRNEIKIGSVSR